jgi:MoaA/NifB/PqqE/SkfB family radical SAM enzyme
LISFAEVSLGAGGLPACVRCEAPEALAPVLRSADEIESELARISGAWGGEPGPNVAFVGAEPFAHPELPTLVMAAGAAGFERLRLRTGATPLAAHDNAEGVLHAGVRHIEAVLLAAGAAHDELSAMPGAFAAAMSGLERLHAIAQQAALPVAVTGYIPACRHNFEHLSAAVAALAEVGAVAVEIALAPGAADAVALERHLLPALDTGVVNGVWVSVSGLPADASWLPPLHRVGASTAIGGGAA